MKPFEQRAAAVGAADDGDIHIAGALVHSRPLNLMQIIRAIDAIDGAQVYQSSAEGKVVVVVEAATGKQVLDVLDVVRALPGVLNVSLVYQHAEPASSMKQELDS